MEKCIGLLRLKNSIEYRKDQVSGEINSVLDSLQSIEISISNKCNRFCSFCPKKSGSFMSTHTFSQIVKYLLDIEFTGRIGLSGFGEPLINKELSTMILLAGKLPGTIEIVTNGDYLDVKLVKILDYIGVDKFLISLYDGSHQIQEFEDIFEKAGVSIDKMILRRRYETNKNFNNRAGLLNKEKKDGPCYLPFYKLMINWNGDYHVCSNDWTGTTAKFNVRNMSIKEFWVSKQMEEYRLDLLQGKRSLSPCNKCDCEGTLVGEAQFNYFEKHYEKNTLE